MTCRPPCADGCVATVLNGACIALNIASSVAMPMPGHAIFVLATRWKAMPSAVLP